MRVNAICPGLIITGTQNRHLPPGKTWGDLSFSAMRRPGKPEEVAADKEVITAYLGAREVGASKEVAI